MHCGVDGFTSPPKEGVPRIFIALKDPLPQAGYEPATLGSSSKHDNHYITEDGCVISYLCLCFRSQTINNGFRLR
jgi:hypothetical protein